MNSSWYEMNPSWCTSLNWFVPWKTWLVPWGNWFIPLSRLIFLTQMALHKPIRIQTCKHIVNILYRKAYAGVPLPPPPLTIPPLSGAHWNTGRLIRIHNLFPFKYILCRGPIPLPLPPLSGPSLHVEAGARSNPGRLIQICSFLHIQILADSFTLAAYSDLRSRCLYRYPNSGTLIQISSLFPFISWDAYSDLQPISIQV